MDEKLCQLQEQRKWTLQQDTVLRSCLEEVNNTFLSSIDRLEMMENRLRIETDLLFIRLENIHSNISALKMSRLVEERILDVPVEGSSPKQKLQFLSAVTSEDRTTNAIRKALKSCLANVSKVRMPNGSDNFYRKRPLPPIIGTSEFYSPSVDKKSCTISSKLEDISKLTASNSNNCIPPPPPPPPPPITISTPVTKPNKQKPVVDDNASLRSAVTVSERTASLKGELDSSVNYQHNQHNIVDPQSIRALPHPKDKSRLTSIFDEDDDEEVDNSQCEVSKEVAEKSLFVQEIQRATAHFQKVSIYGETDQVVSGKATPQNLEVVEEDQQGAKEGQIIDDKLITEENLTFHQSAVSRNLPIEPTGKKNPPVEPSNFTFSQSNSSESQKPTTLSSSSKKSSVIKKTSKSLFSSSSSEEEILAEKRIVPNPSQGEEEIVSEDEMSRPVLKSLDAKFSDRLSAVLKNGPVMRPDKAGSSTARRPVSTSIISTKEIDDEDRGRAISGRARENKVSSSRSSVSSNEELGPSSVASRIAQIGDRIPVRGRQRSGDISTTEKVGTGEAVGGKNDVSKPPVPNLVMGRAKGPARRAPSNMPKSGNVTNNIIGVSLPTTSDYASIGTKRSESSSKNEVNSSGKLPPSTAAAASRKNPSSIETSVHRKPAESPSVSSSKSVSRPSTVVDKPPPASKVKSIFDSSSSDDDFLSGNKNTSTTARVAQSSSAVTNRPFTTTTTRISHDESSNATVVSALKNGGQNNAALGRGSLLSAPSTKKKGLFDDSDSDI